MQGNPGRPSGPLAEVRRLFNVFVHTATEAGASIAPDGRLMRQPLHLVVQDTDKTLGIVLDIMSVRMAAPKPALSEAAATSSSVGTAAVLAGSVVTGTTTPLLEVCLLEPRGPHPLVHDPPLLQTPTPRSGAGGSGLPWSAMRRNTPVLRLASSPNVCTGSCSPTNALCPNPCPTRPDPGPDPFPNPCSDPFLFSPLSHRRVRPLLQPVAQAVA